MKLNKKDIKVLTPNGYEFFLGVNKITKSNYLDLTFNDGKNIKCSLDHPFDTIEGIIKAKDLTKKIEVFTKLGGCFLKHKKLIKKEINLYDIVNSGEKHLYFTNDIISHNCNFLGSADTLISGLKLQTLVTTKPIKTKNYFDIYENPKKDHQYMITVDVARGVDLDYSAFVVFDITKLPYKVVAKYRNNSIKPLMLPYVIKDAGINYNKAYVLCETNDVGNEVATALHYDLEYPNLLTCFIKSRQGQILGQGFGGNKAELGVKMSSNIKKIGCLNLKMLLEEDKLELSDFETISELTTFIQRSGTFKAEEGKNDDLVICLVIFAWAATSTYFRDITDDDIRKRLFQEKIDSEDDDLMPMGFLEDGLMPETFIQDDKVWYTVPEEDMLYLWNQNF